MAEKRSKIVFVVGLTVLIGISSRPVVTALGDDLQAQLPPRGSAGNPSVLVRELGDKSFAVRARATRLLTQIGSPAIPALKSGNEKQSA